MTETEGFDRVMTYMNTECGDSLLLYAWNLFNEKNANSAQIVDINKDKFTLRIKTSGVIKAFDYSVDKVFNFRPQLLSVAESRERLFRLTTKCSVVVWPPGLGPYVSIGLWVSMLLCIAQAKEILQYTIIQKLREYSLLIFRTPEVAAYGLILMIVVHVFESVYVIYLLRHIAFSPGGKQTWISLTFLLGAPITLKAYELSCAASKRGRGFGDKFD